jgi:LmbE family N-acetylglucosaminyl deacetylase
VARGPSAACTLLFPAAGPAWTGITEFYFWKFDTPSFYVNITSTMQDKINAFAQHKSQYPSSTPAGLELVAEMLTNVAHMTANNAGVNALIEGFQAFN